MAEKLLHGVNLTGCVAQIATAADLTFAGGATTAAGGAMSLLALARGKTDGAAPLAERMLAALDDHLANSHLSGDLEKHVVQAFERYLPTQQDFIDGEMEAAAVARAMRLRVKDTAIDTAHKTQETLDAYEHLLRDVLGPILEPQTLEQALLFQILRNTAISGEAQRLREAEITEAAIVGLAQRIAADTNDLPTAWAELQEAMEIALRVQAEGRARSNHGDFVNEVLRRVAAHAATGDYDAATRAIDAALEEAHAARARLLTSGVEIAVLNRDAPRAAELLIAQADLAAGGRADFADLRRLFLSYYERGRDRGTALDLEIAIALAQMIHQRAADPDERGSALNDLGVALQTLGARDTGSDRLEEAVTAYHNALEEWTRDRVPLDWAMTQMNLGNALQILGARETGTARLEEAVTAYRNALEEGTRDRVPLDWALAKMNLGNALRTLGVRETGTARLEEAVTACRDALIERTHDKMPLAWARTQMNLGNALLTLGERESGTARLQEAVTAFRNALQEQTRERVPLEWAMVQANLASLSLTFFDKTGAPSHLDTARGYAEAALEVFAEAGASQYVAMINATLKEIDARRSGRAP